MNAPLAVLVRHNRWANLRLLDACAALSAEQLDATAVGGYGSIRVTLAHIAGPEERSLRAITGEESHATILEQADPDLATIREHLDASGRAFIAIAEETIAERAMTVRWHGEHWMPVSLFLAQAINHATEHRTQAASILTGIGVQRLEIHVWAFTEPE